MEILASLLGIAIAILGWFLAWVFNGERDDWFEVAQHERKESDKHLGELSFARKTIERLERELRGMSDEYAAAFALAETRKCDLAKCQEEMLTDRKSLSALHDERDHWQRRYEQGLETMSGLRENAREQTATAERNDKTIKGLQADLRESSLALTSMRVGRDHYEDKANALQEQLASATERLEAIAGLCGAVAPVPDAVKCMVSTNECCHEGL